MKLVETKTYKVEITNEEKMEIVDICYKLKEIEHQFYDKDTFFIDGCDEKCVLEESYIEHVIEFLQALAEDEVEVY